MADKRQMLQNLAQRYCKNALHQRCDHVGTASEALSWGRRVPRSAVFIACLRDLNIPARYVSGYIYEASDAMMASHAWAEVWLHGNWYTFDVSNQHFTPNCHVYVAIGRDYLDAAPVRGVRLGGGYENLFSQVMVTALPS